jgi:hypothetical protein
VPVPLELIDDLRLVEADLRGRVLGRRKRRNEQHHQPKLPHAEHAVDE